MPLKQSGYSRWRSSFEFNGGGCSLTAQFKVTKLSLRQEGSPKITGPGVSATKNSASCEIRVLSYGKQVCADDLPRTCR